MRRVTGAALAAVIGLLGVAHAARAASPEPATVTSGPLTLVAEPQAGVAPFVSMIAGARHSIEMTMYELTDTRVEGALEAAAHRGVDVRVLLNGGYYSERESTNDAAVRALAGHGVHVQLSPTYFALTHQKTLTVDGRESAVMTLNFDGEYATTRDFAVLDRRSADVSAVVATFDADWAHRRITPPAGSGDLVWSPGAASAVVRMIQSAHRSIALEDEEMAYAPATSALCAAARRGVAVTIVMTWESDWYDAFSELKHCGANVRVDHGQSYYIHAKVLVVDDREALVSSQNLSDGSLERNRELGITLTSPPLVHALAADVAADAATAPAFYY
ncbi:MAG TPA: phospholipase D-like domain-containing protein [Solirubrobacteraceae bacterium]|nr:phospholipase D-like domain-containing protein [Solirubrobacteraceae bacterium]